MIFLALLALILFGPRKLPEMARQLGRFMAEFKRASNEFQHQIHEEIRKLDAEDSAKTIAPPPATNANDDAKGAPAAFSGPTVGVNGDTEGQSGPISTALNRLTDRIKNIPQE